MPALVRHDGTHRTTKKQIPYRTADGTPIPEYTCWLNLRTRCRNPKRTQIWKNYGGRGITVCAEWDDFATFLRDMGPRPSPEHSIDRKDNDAGYSKDNCRWATVAEQNANRKRRT